MDALKIDPQPQRPADERVDVLMTTLIVKLDVMIAGLSAINHQLDRIEATMADTARTLSAFKFPGLFGANGKR
jgi:hypothetical protein